MIDIHTHILPGIDDGAPNEQESIAMAQQALDQGITTMIATPHHKNSMFENHRDSILKYTDILNELFQENSVSLQLLPGQEARLNSDFLTDLANNELLPLNQTRYLFIELPFDHVPAYTERMMYDIQMKGYIPVIAHPERNRQLLEEPDVLYDLVQKGALTQVTSGSLFGEFGKDVERLTHKIIEHHLTHFVATDAHNTSARPVNLAKAYEHIQHTFGVDTYYTFIENAEYLIDDDAIFRQEPKKIRKRRLFGFL